MNEPLEKKRQPMVGWFNPSQLLDTGLQTLFSSIIGKYSDRRLIQALASRRKEIHDYTFHYKDTEGELEIDPTRPRKEIWLDFIADTGDGWNPTYAIAYYASQPSLQLKRRDADPVYATERGSVLIFGGDEVYPSASRENYEQRLVAPFSAAYGEEDIQEHPHVFAIPGNHDWYDGLTSFIRLFCSDLTKRNFAGWRTRQNRSYFALKLPGHWWLLGSDGQLQSNMDTPQMEYFRFVADKFMEQGDRVILCIAEPVWIGAHKYRKFGSVYDESDLLFLQQEILSKKNVEIKVYLAGDLHHYRRHEETGLESSHSPTQKIAAGGGGAFLHPTHGEDLSSIAEISDIPDMKTRLFVLKKSFPEIKESRRLCWRNLGFLWRNPRFGILPGFLYLMTAWIVGSTIGPKHPRNLLRAMDYTASAFLDNPGIAAWTLFVIALFILFTDTHSRIYRWAGGIAHCFAHFFCIFYIAWGVVLVSGRFIYPNPILQFLAGGAAIFFAGWIAGSFVMGLYLLISLNVFGRHDEEAFSALRIEDYKNFLRLHISEDGTLTIYPIQVEKVPRKWRTRDESEKTKIHSRVVPVGGSGVELIEDPIRIESRKIKT